MKILEERQQTRGSAFNVDDGNDSLIARCLSVKHHQHAVVGILLSNWIFWRHVAKQENKKGMTDRRRLSHALCDRVTSTVQETVRESR
jgi:hypothetical protein